MRTLIAVLCLAVAAQAAYEQEWQAFKTEFKKTYEGAEEAFRFNVFVENSKKIEEHNKLFDQGLSTFKMGVNQFADMLSHEFAAKMNGYKSRAVKGELHEVSGSALPDTVDWRTEGAVTGVKDQGQCGSCWAFSTTGGLEGQHFLKNGRLVSLSEQQLVDCSRDYGNAGCQGGLMVEAYRYIKENGGIDTEASYPYTARNGQCHYDEANKAASVEQVKMTMPGDEDALQDAVANIGPISVAMDASHTSFQLYTSGIYSEPRCSTTVLDHGVLAAGYGTEAGKAYWLVKNSWGTSWGEQGYFKMARNDGNMCGIATDPSYPIV